MGLRIKSNIDSMMAQRQLSENQDELSNSLEKLSSGLRINKSSDDAAGLAISETMRAKIRSFGQAKRNASDGISFLQTGEGGLSELNNIIIRMRELTTQAASDTIGETERGFLNKEFQELGKEVNRIKDQTEFNGRKLLSPEDQRDINVQVGVNFRNVAGETNEENEVITLKFDDLTDLSESLANLTELSIEGENGRELGGGNTEDIFSALDDSMLKVTRTRATLGALQSRLNSTITSIDIGSENLSAAQSRIRDADYGLESAKYAQSKILVSAGTSVLAQANQIPDSVLHLLR
ncbi:flagellin N-terminal helical domain-containing protein [Pigmentibacter ruber]|uniref:flagellin N-terminal helical domain-containing protein n=1 Tax=Pigmentibacter ruber TaxID=2683196 RepID=UPI00131D345E|nr:flagellin [Pigmentibacter ruber]BFD31426.1 flagellin [Pigmentibacter ruber]